MPKKTKTTEEYITEAVSRWGNIYDYSLVEYTGCDNKIDIVCPIHGKFSIRAASHLRGYGCKKCAIELRYKDGKVRGVGINDIPLSSMAQGGMKDPVYVLWSGILNRVTTTNPKHSAYFDVTICNEWLRFSTFKQWMLNPANGYKAGYAIDKDIIRPGSKIYNPQSCCFVPSRINLLFVMHDDPSDKPTGVIHVKNKYFSHIKVDDTVINASFDTLSEAMDDYVNKKTNIIRDVANEYYSRGEITKRVHDAMLVFPVREYLTNYNKFNV